MNGIMHITVTGDLDKIGNFAERINECYKMFQGTAHEGSGDLFYDSLHLEWHVERGGDAKKRGRKRSVDSDKEA